MSVSPIERDASTIPAPMASSLAAAVVLFLLGACASPPMDQPDDPVDRLIAEDAAKAAAAQPSENNYPDLRDVPPRPTLGYTVEQRRRIQQGLVADMEYAQRTSDLVRTTDGATPPPPPSSPAVVPGEPPAAEAATAPVRPPSKVVLIERRDTSGDFSSFLNDVVGLETEVDSAQGQVRVAPGTGQTPTPGPALTDGLTGGDVVEAIGGTPAPDTEPGFFSAMAGVFGGATDETVVVTPDQAGDGAAQLAGEALPAGRRWTFPLDPAATAPSDDALASMLAEVTAPGALRDRRLAVAAHAASSLVASERVRAVVADLVDHGVAREAIEARSDPQGPDDAVVVSVLPTSG
ncbi:MAG TPA: hypothetical protein VHL31_20830 [Geminicoccus sp.]|jgi:hypothetical protein|uniref:hypothetical protein n=1 Tax=Geminicoccus sp. TaxID=2024832 RepID=UPI002E3395C9|nr:hypothetical protein [Geminicoccus sp.]HEX2528725.1 hypothetical protein [Geminicoccus sp.]